MKQPALIICLSGPRGAGKTTVSRLLKNKYGAIDVHIGYVLEAMAKRKGLKVKEFAQQLLAEKGKEAIAEAVSPYVAGAAKKTGVVLVQGIYRPEDISALRRIFPQSNFHTIFVEAPSNLRVRRVVARDKLDETGATKSVNSVDIERKEFGFLQVKKLVNHRVHNDKDLPTLFRRLNRGLKKSVKKTGYKLVKRR